MFLVIQVHISDQSTVADHCRQFALSDPGDNDYHQLCDHVHSDICARCQALDLVLSNIKTACDSEYVSLTPEDKEEILYSLDHAAHNIHLWKAHQLRSVNQDSCKQDILSLMDEGAVMITLDWAMKYLPRKYRESQTEWYAKRGLPWHISVVTRKSGNGLSHFGYYSHI